MSITTAPATVTGIRATSATGEPFTVTAEITTDTLGTAYLHVVVDGDLHSFKLDRHLLRLREQSVQDEATRLLQRHAGYKPASAWTEAVPGRLTAPLAEIAGRCLTCVHGCGHGVGDKGCAHWQCLAATPEIANTCQGAVLALTAKWPGSTQPKRATKRPGGRLTARDLGARTTKRNRRGDWFADAPARS